MDEFRDQSVRVISTVSNCFHGKEAHMSNYLFRTDNLIVRCIYNVANATRKQDFIRKRKHIYFEKKKEKKTRIKM